ncbi:MAG: FHA domain-containing protein [Armatimonadetes bacterium]|nr:FHA domain-containing protein [Armatimonadota bacterium]
MDTWRLTPGDEVFGRYKVTGALGEGAQAVVYRGVDTKEPRDVAIKQLKEATESLAKRFRNESKLSLSTEHIVRNYDFGEVRGKYANVMEFVDGDTLEDRLRWVDDFDTLTCRGTAVPEDEARDVIAQAAEGLACAHASNVIHRDIKPANLLIRRADRRVKVTDFGVARFMGDPHDAGRFEDPDTQLDDILGTILWMSPEQWVDPSAADCRADVWSLGVVFYQAVTGRYPFLGAGAGAVARTVLSDNPARPRKLNPALSEETEAIILKMLAKELDDRFQRMTDVQRALGAEVVCVLSACPQCGVETETGNRFCTGCGYDLVELPMKLAGTGGMHAGLEFPVRGDLVRVGRRREGNDIHLLADECVSRWHLRFRKEGATRTVEAWDWNQGKKPANETLLNGFDINGKGPQPIKVGDKLRMGDSWFELRPG